MRLIDLDQLMEYPIRLAHYDKEHGDIHFVYGVESVIEYTEHLPIVDAVPVIRCKDCKFLKTPSGWQVGNVLYCGEFVSCKHPKNNHISTEIDGYCFRGERKDNG